MPHQTRHVLPITAIIAFQRVISHLLDGCMSQQARGKQLEVHRWPSGAPVADDNDPPTNRDPEVKVER